MWRGRSRPRSLELTLHGFLCVPLCPLWLMFFLATVSVLSNHREHRVHRGYAWSLDCRTPPPEFDLSGSG